MEESTDQKKHIEKGELYSEYANNCHFEPSVWDLKLIFGQLDQHLGNATVDWHTEITLPWAQAKILSYFLQVNIAIHETHNGRIKIPEAVFPPKPDLSAIDLEKEPKGKAVFEAIERIYQEFLKIQK